MKPSDDLLDKLVRSNFEIANKHYDVLRSLSSDEERQRWVRNLFDTYEVVWGVWNDPVTGVGMFPLKGDATLRARAAGPVSELKMTAILCTAEEGAEAKALADARRAMLG